MKCYSVQICGILNDLKSSETKKYFFLQILIEMTGQVLDSPVASLVLPVLMRPILSNLERQDMVASQTLRAALSKVSDQTGAGPS